jgi:hypothetical protein
VVIDLGLKYCRYCNKQFKTKTEAQIYCSDFCYYKDDEEEDKITGRSEIGGY